MQQTGPGGLAATLARAFGNVAIMSTLYDDDVVWALPASLGPLSGPHRGRAAVVAFNELVDTAYDPASVAVTILDDLTQGDLSVARFIYQARMLPSGEPFKGEYALYVRSLNGRIIEVQERLDTLAVYRARVAMGQAELFGEAPPTQHAGAS